MYNKSGQHMSQHPTMKTDKHPVHPHHEAVERNDAQDRHRRPPAIYNDQNRQIRKDRKQEVVWRSVGQMGMAADELRRGDGSKIRT